MPQKVEFHIAYDGEALRDHSMDVRTLAPALLSLGQLFDEANRLLNADKAQVKLQVRATESGSFGVLLELAQSFYTHAAQFLTGDFIESALNLKELLLGSAGLLWLIKRLKGRNPDNVERLENGSVMIYFEGDTLVIPLKLLRLYQDAMIRRSMEDVVRPLGNDGIDTFVVKEDGETLSRVRKEERIYFDVPEVEQGDELIASQESVGAYAIISPVFKDDNKWRLSDGNANLNVAILDKNFLRRVDDQLELFGKGDILRCRVRTQQWKTKAGLKTEHEVLEVIDHLHGGRQAKLFELPDDHE